MNVEQRFKGSVGFEGLNEVTGIYSVPEMLCFTVT
jgi:hypothetical protein